MRRGHVDEAGLIGEPPSNGERRLTPNLVGHRAVADPAVALVRRLGADAQYTSDGGPRAACNYSRVDSDIEFVVEPTDLLVADGNPLKRRKMLGH